MEPAGIRPRTVQRRVESRDGVFRASPNELRLLMRLHGVAKGASGCQLLSTTAARDVVDSLVPEATAGFESSIVVPDFVQPPPKDEEVRAWVLESQQAVGPLPNDPLSVVLPPAAVALVSVSPYAVSEAELKTPAYTRLAGWLHRFEAWLTTKVLLDREAAAASASAAKEHVERLRRFIGLCRSLGLPLKPEAFLNGNAIAAMVVFMAQRAQERCEKRGVNPKEGGEARDGILAMLSTLARALEHAAAVDWPLKKHALDNLKAGVKALARQYKAGTAPAARADMHTLIEQGLAIPFAELSKHGGVYARRILERVHASPHRTAELADSVKWALVVLLVTCIPAQRATAVRDLQIARTHADVFDKRGNALVWDAAAGVWRISFRVHKNSHRHGSASATINTFAVPGASYLAQMLAEWTDWAEDVFMDRCGYPPLSQTLGLSFLNSKGRPYDRSSWYSLFVKAVQQATGNDALRMGPSQMRRLVADSEEVDDAAGGNGTRTRHAIAHAMGHSLETERQVYRAPPSSGQLAAAARSLTGLQRSLVQQHDEAAEEREPAREEQAGAARRGAFWTRPSPEGDDDFMTSLEADVLEAVDAAGAADAAEAAEVAEAVEAAEAREAAEVAGAAEAAEAAAARLPVDAPAAPSARLPPPPTRFAQRDLWEGRRDLVAGLHFGDAAARERFAGSRFARYLQGACGGGGGGAARDALQWGPALERMYQACLPVLESHVERRGAPGDARLQRLIHASGEAWALQLTTWGRHLLAAAEDEADADERVAGLSLSRPPPLAAGTVAAEAVGDELLPLPDGEMSDDEFELEMTGAGASAAAPASRTPAKRGRARRALLPGAALLDVDSVYELSVAEMREAYLGIYGKPTASGNLAWLFAALTGLAASKYKPRLTKRARSASSDG